MYARYVPRVDVDDEEKSDEGRAPGKVRFKRESAGATSARKKKETERREKRCEKSCRTRAMQF